ncbi:MAG: DUF1648 domain-containing protein, partial [Blastocatellia bacterium]
MIFRIVVLVSYILLGALVALKYWVLPAARREEAFFGIRISSSVYCAEGQQLLTWYRRQLLIALIAIGAIGVAVSISQIGSVPNVFAAGLATVLMEWTAAVALYARSHSRAKPYETTGEAVPVALSLQKRRLADYSNLKLEIALAFLNVVPIVILALAYHSLPARIPDHIAPDGSIDWWSDKTLREVFALPFFSLYAQGLLLLSKLGRVKAALTLPADHTEEYLKCKRQALRLRTQTLDLNRAVLAIATPLSLLIFLRVAGHPNISHQISQYSAIAVIALYFACIARLAKPGREIRRQLKETTGKVYVERPTPGQYWIGGR